MLPHPTLDAPAPLRGSDPDSFAHHTVTTRLPDLLRRTRETGNFPRSADAHLQALAAELPYGLIRGIDDPSAPDTDDWAAYVSAMRGQDWLSVPWFFAETYFYRRILEATGYFGGPCPGVDPFAAQKSTSLATDTDAIHRLADRLDSSASTADGDSSPQSHAVVAALTTALWGNQADLSMWPGGDRPPAGATDGSAALSDGSILADDRARCARWICDRAPLGRVDLVIDNAGFELVSDLALVHHLLTSGAAQTVIVHAKSHPTFVSDATSSDVYHLLGELAESEHAATRAFGADLQTAAGEGRLAVTVDLFWTSPLPGWGLFGDLYRTLRASSLIVSKGDANYRRWLGDRHWAPTAGIEAILDYAPAPLLLLRTLKSEVIAGLRPRAMDRAASEDPDWRVSGDRGVAQFIAAPHGHPAYDDEREVAPDDAGPPGV